MMFGKFINSSARNLYKTFNICAILLLLFVSGANSDPIVKNEVEDLNVIISQIVGGEPNVLFIMDLSGSMERAFGGSQVGNWDNTADGGTLIDCEAFNCSGSCNDFIKRSIAAHCAENVAGVSKCGSRYCNSIAGTCDTQDKFDEFLQCIDDESALTDAEIEDQLDLWCGDNDGIYEPTTDDICGVSEGLSPDDEREYEGAAAALDARASFTECSAANCTADDDSDPFNDYACDLSTEYTNFRTCMLANQAININQAENCIGGTSSCTGQPAYGSSRFDMTLSVIFDFLDGDDSLADKMCDDSGMLFDGTSSSISCHDYMTTPFRNVRQIVRQDGNPASNRRLPITGANDTFLLDELTDDDRDEVGVRLRPMIYSGEGNWDGCTDNNTFSLPQGGFAGASQAQLQNVWKFFRRQEGDGGTPLAWVLGFDDNDGNGSGGGNVINDDALGAFRVELQTDPAIGCRPEFVVILTDGEDTCAGEPGGPSGNGQTSGILTTNANRRSSIQAVSNLRTYFVRNPVQNRGTTYKKEILTFVIGLGVNDPVGRRTLNAMALAGGTHTKGVIEHVGPDGVLAPGTVDIDSGSIFPQGSEFNIFKDLARVEGIDTNASSAQLQDCQSADRSESGHCHFQSGDIFDNLFFDTGVPFNNVDKRFKDFAFFVNDADELAIALQTITNFIKIFSTSGVSPAAPQSSTAVALRDRIFLSILTPITTERLWQGRMGLYGFVDEPGNFGSKVVISKPDSSTQDLTDATIVASKEIFDNNGTLNEEAKKFFWEAAKELAERDIANSKRNLYTVLAPDLTITDPYDAPEFETSDGVILYKPGLSVDKGGLVSLDLDASDTTGKHPVSPGQFGISDDDVTSPIPDFCIPDGGLVTECRTLRNPSSIVDCQVPSDQSCKDCVKECIRDEILSFMIGNTDIATVGDPMGDPSLGSQTDSSMGYNCPDPSGEVTTGSLATCSVRMGDVFHSNPVVVGSPSPLFFDAGYQQFAFAFKDRSAVVYAGANDGFLHGFHAGEFTDPIALDPDNDGDPTTNPVKNPFTNMAEIFPFFSPGTGFEMFGVAMPTFLADSLETPASMAQSPAEIVFGSPSPPDYRTGDFKTFVIDNIVQRSFADDSPVIGDVYIDGFGNGIPIDSSICNSSPVGTADGDIDLCGREWHTVLLSGARNGGGAYIALDVTNPSFGDCSTGDPVCEHVDPGSGTLEYPTHLWTLFDPDFGNTWSTASMGRIRLEVNDGGTTKTVDRWVMFVGGGLDPEDTDPTDGVDFGNAFVVVDIPTGRELFKFHPDNPLPSGTGAPDNINDMVCDVASRVGAFDINSDGYMDLAYVGDTCGRLWRFDISEPIQVSGSIAQTGPGGTLDLIAEDWTGQIAFCANTDAECFGMSGPAVPQNNLEPIYFAPTVVLDDLGRRHVIFVTGDRRDPSNITKHGRLYNFIDDYIPAFIAGGTSLGGATIKTADDFMNSGQVIELEVQSGLDGQFVTTPVGGFNADQGEFLIKFPSNLTNPEEGEKGFGVPVVIRRVLIFTTFAPPTDNTDACSGGTGLGRIFALDYISGQAALTRIPGVTDSGLLQGTSAQKDAAAGLTVAEGMPTPAQLTFGAGGSVLMSVAFTGGPVAGGSQFIVWELPPLPTRTQTLFWEELL